MQTQKALPRSMRAVVLKEYRANLLDAIAGLTIEDRDVQLPKAGQVLIRVDAAPCNPSDLLLLQGKYGSLKHLPTVPGWEGTGTVIASGGGFLGYLLQGRRVSCALSADRDGTWAEYFVGEAKECIALKKAMPTEQAACLIVNPFTAVGLLDTARRAGHAAAVQTAAASQLGRMILAMAHDSRFPLINVVRRREQVELLRSLDAEYVLDSSDTGFHDQLKALCNELNATALFEAVGGSLTGDILATMPRQATAYLYGALSEEPVSSIDPIDIIFHDKSIQGFYLGNWLKQRGVTYAVRKALRIQNLILSGKIGTKIQRRLKYDEVVDGLKHYAQNMTDGKVLICPQ